MVEITYPFWDNSNSMLVKGVPLFLFRYTIKVQQS